MSNIGSIGGKFATPLVTAREVAIVALGRWVSLLWVIAAFRCLTQIAILLTWGIAQELNTANLQ